MAQPSSLESRLIQPASRGELERRWSLLRARLAERKVDVLIVVGHTNELDGAVRWLTDGIIGYRHVVMFHRDGPATVINHGFAGSRRKSDGNEPGYRGVGEIISTSSFNSVDYTQHYEAEIVVEIMRERGYRRIALYHPNALPYGFHKMLRDELPEVEFVDESEFLDTAKAVKSPWEVDLLRRSTGVQDEVVKRTLSYAKPGMKDGEVAAYAFYQARLLGGDGGLTMVGSAPPGEPALMRGGEQGGRVIQAGDAMTLLVENGGPGGYFLEIGRTVSFGAATPAMKEAFRISVEAQAFTVSLCKPGARCSEIYAAYADHMKTQGLPADRRIFAHGQGYDLIERPLIRQDETMTLQAGMCLAVHPGALVDGAFAFVCGNILIREGGAEFLHETPRKLFEL